MMQMRFRSFLRKAGLRRLALIHIYCGRLNGWRGRRRTWGRASVVLGKLTAVDPGGQLGNRPSHSLREIFVAWHPSTLASVAERLSAIEAIRTTNADVAWKLAMALMPQGHDVASPTDKPRWRAWLPPSLPTATIADYWTFIEGLVRRMITWAASIPARHLDLLSVYNELWHGHPELAKEVLSKLFAEQIEAWPDADKAAFVAQTRELLTRHREYADADWAMPEEALQPIDELQVAPNLPAQLIGTPGYLIAVQHIDGHQMRALRRAIADSGNPATLRSETFSMSGG